ncbi:retinol-binding protein 3 isoform X1 [Danio rerio]|uniref:Retinol-binding protein 3 n=4 Tax=Bilateria TaxID=33213 RepID=F1Q9N9_DANRE|nr:retinol-binding protein 3 precursor [Danio rerio]|eukprot:NP_571526.2 retinol-binding protein 3 precursor [Danio rerio]
MAQALVLLVSLLFFSNVAHCNFSPTLIADMAKIFMDNYCSPEKLTGMEEAIDAASSNTEILSISDPTMLANVLTDGVKKTISDSRVKVTYEPDLILAAPPAMPDIPLEHLAAMIKGTVKVEILEGNIGYLKIQHIIGEEMAQKVGPLLLEYIWDKILPTSAMILDFRSTVTGELSGIPYIVSYFTDPEPLIHIDSVYDRTADLTIELWSMPTLLGKRYGTSKPLIILTSKDTLGIAEDVAYCLKNLKRATIVGENTAGGTVKMSKMKVGDTDFYVTVPVAKSINPITGKSWEINGVAPDVDVAAEDALDAAIAIIKLRAEIPALAQAAATLIADNYAFPSIGEHVAEKLEAVVAGGEYNLISTKEDLEERLSEDLLKLSEDKCLKTTSNIPALPPMNPTPEMFIALIKSSFQTDVFENNIGYLRFDMFGDFEHVATIAQIIVEHVWNKVVDTDALIIDLRNNIGGHASSIAGFCSYFFDADKQIVLDHIYDRPSNTTRDLQTLEQLTGRRYGSKKSVVILTSGVTAGAAEEFVFIMKRLGRAMIIGETTHGGCQPPETFAVGESDIFLSIPISHSDTAQGPSWEGAGIAPHIPVPAGAALDTAKGMLNKHFSGQK